MKRPFKFKPNYLYTTTLIALLLCITTTKIFANTNFYRPLTSLQDTTKPILKKDSSRSNAKDTILPKQKVDTFSLKISKDSLDAPVKYEAKDSAVVLIKEKKILLYGKTKTDYKDITLTAPRVELDQQTQILTAVNRKDSDGAVIETAHFKQKENEFTSDTIRYNFKTQKGLTKNTYTRQGEILVIGETVKKVDSNTTFIKKARFTTCNLDEPHFAFVTNKMKVINNKLAVSGPAHPEFEGVPVPIYIPFGFYPLSQGVHSGFLPPQFTSNETYGLGLEGIGYYKTWNDHWDTKVYGNIYSYGGWSANINPTYRKRYHYAGSFNFGIISNKQNFKGDPDYSKTNVYSIQWNHSIDSRARPGVTFSANVNAGSTKYNRYIPNGGSLLTPGGTPVNFQNQLGSSIAYSKTGTLEALGQWWRDKPYNLTLSANHNQNNFTHLINVSLPTGGFTVNTLYPFQKKESVGSQKWYEKIGIGYSTTFNNNISFYDTAKYGQTSSKSFLKHLLDTAQWSVHHSIPLTMSLPPLLGGNLIVSPSVSYNQDWLQRVTDYSWDSTLKKVDTTTKKGLFIDHQSGFGLSMNTALYGTYQFHNSRIIAIRHVMRPSIGFSYTPDLNKGHIKEVQVDTTGYKMFYNEFGGGYLYNTKTRKSAAVNFQLDNNLEMKLRSKKDTGDNATKRIRLIDGFGFNTSYDFIRDSLNLSPARFYFNTNLFEKFNITASTTLDPYRVDSFGRDINKYAWQGGKFKLGRFTTGSVTVTTTLKSKAIDAKKEEERKKQVQRQLNDPALIADQQRLLDYMQKNPSEFVDFNIPWQLSLSYALYFQEQLKPDYSGFTKKFNSNLNFNGSFNLTAKWNFGMNGYYDFDTKKLQTFTMSISREMHCWQMAINVTPVGLYRYFNISISPKSSILQDLRINRTRYFNY